jgi:hypothetical protein
LNKELEKQKESIEKKSTEQKATEVKKSNTENELGKLKQEVENKEKFE